jgi:Protein of unknown function (DUF669)
MPRVPIDFEGVQDFDVLPEGLYEGEIEEIKWKDATAEGKFPQLSVKIRVTGGDLDGRRAFQNLSMSPQSKYRVKRFFNKFDLADGMEGLEYEEDSMLVVDPDLTGEPVAFKVKHRTWNEELRAEVEVVEWLGGGDAQPEPEPVRAEPKPVPKPEPAPEPEDEAEEAPEAEPAPRAPARAGSGAPRRQTATAPARRVLR